MSEPEHCGNDCRVGDRPEDDGLEPMDCVCCPCCCTCTPCEYAEDRAMREAASVPDGWSV